MQGRRGASRRYKDRYKLIETPIDVKIIVTGCTLASHERTKVRRRIQEYNSVLQTVCAKHARPALGSAGPRNPSARVRLDYVGRVLERFSLDRTTWRSAGIRGACCPILLPQHWTHRLAKTTGNRDVGEVGKASLIGTHHLPLPASCRRSDD